MTDDAMNDKREAGAFGEGRCEGCGKFFEGGMLVNGCCSLKCTVEPLRRTHPDWFTDEAALTPSPVTPDATMTDTFGCADPDCYGCDKCEINDKSVTPDASGLLPCPFDGWEAHESRNTVPSLIGCRNPKCVLNRAVMTKDQWNTRTPSSLAELEAEVESLKGVVKDCYGKLSAADAYAEALQAKLDKRTKALEVAKDGLSFIASGWPDSPAQEILFNADKEESGNG